MVKYVKITNIDIYCGLVPSMYLNIGIHYWDAMLTDKDLNP